MYARYLDKNTFRPKLIEQAPHQATALIVVIPVYDEESVLLPLKHLQACDTTDAAVEVILVFNAAENEASSVKQKNTICKAAAVEWYKTLKNPRFQLFCIVENNLPKKHAGVGLARKIGMDEALRRFDVIHQKKGIIICFDADSACDSNYLAAIETHFERNPRASACSIYFEHPFHFKHFSKSINQGIIFYELHLRYYKNALAFAKLPYAFHTVGSSMAVRAKTYCEEGGMNRRKAGEDFYFLQKFIKRGTFTELNNTRVIPSPRTSDRVPFGTGRAIQEMISGERDLQKSYAFDSFLILKAIFEHVEQWYQDLPDLPDPFLEFVGRKKLEEKVEEIRSQVSSVENFVKRLFHWFDAFRTLKFLHFLRDNYYEQEQVVNSSKKLLSYIDPESNVNGEIEILERFRDIDRGLKTEK